MLTGKQKRQLRAMANTKKAIFQVGKEGLSYNFISSLDLALEVHELVKVSVLKTCPEDFETMAFDMAASTQSEVVQTIGRTIVLYRESENHLIDLQ